MRQLIILIILLVSTSAFGQVPEKLVHLQGNGQFIGFGEVLEDMRAITFWIKFDQKVGTSLQTEMPILVRDNGNAQTFNPGEFAVYMGKQGTADAGKLVFSRSSETQAYTISSDQNAWFSNRWYHIGLIIHPTQGMQMYVNGILQQDTDPTTFTPYMRSEGTTGTVYLGKWGSVSGYGIEASFDELRIYSSALSQNQLREKMCKIETLPNNALTGYFNFDNAAGTNLPTLSGSANGTMNGLTPGDFKTSNVPVGESSAYSYDTSPGTSIGINQQIQFTVDSMQTNAAGVHLYSTFSNLLSFVGSFPHFFGVWFTDTTANYRATLNFQTLGLNCDSCTEISSRDNQKINTWTTRTDVPNNCVYTLPTESPGNQEWREEYWVKPRLEISSGLDDTITKCQDVDLVLIARQYPGARYLWDDGSTQRGRRADSTGIYVVNIKWHGCAVTDTVFVKRSYMPKFQLPNDTAICIGDTFFIKAPLDIDSAEYSWGNGIHFGRQFPMWYAGTITLKITVGQCSWEDAITVDLINNFQLELGDDTTVCLGQEFVLEAPDNVNYLWSTGETGKEVRLFNRSEKVWIEAWNSCFYKTDTIEVTYEECDCRIFVANTFTPNNDGVNDFFHPITSCYYEEYDIEIYDRWGSMVFKTTDITSSWDGTFQGRNMPEGVYTYQLRYKKYSWDEISSYEHGNITLMR